MTWEIDYNGTRKTFADWGIAGVTRRLVNQGRDDVRFRADGREFDAAELFPYGSVLTFYRDSIQWFYGKVIQTPRNARGRAENQEYVVAGPWWWLEELVMQVDWFAGLSSHLILNIGLAPINTVINTVLDFAIAAGAPIQKGNITPAIIPPADETRDLSCAAVIVKELRWCLADAVTWFDYSTSPPTFHCKLSSELTTATLDEPLASLKTDPRYDLQRPGVVIKYEIRNEVDDVELMSLSIDKYPLSATGRELGALVLTIDLLGIRANNLFASILTQPIDATSANAAARVAWWKAKKPELAHLHVTFNSVSVATRQTALANELLEGQITSWMPFTAEQDTIKATAVYTLYDKAPSDPTAKILADKVNVEINTTLMATDGETGDYNSTEIEEAGEAIPVGLAEFLYNRVATLQWQGEIERVQAEVDGAVGMGNRLTVQGNDQVQAVLIQSVVESVDDGRTVLQFGPPEHLDVAGLLSLLRVGRDRQRITPTSTYETGALGSAGEARLGKQTSKSDTTEGEGQTKVFRVLDGTKEAVVDATTGLVDLTSTDGRTVQIRLSDIVGPSNKTIKLRAYNVCVLVDNVPTTKRALLLGSEPYDP